MGKQRKVIRDLCTVYEAFAHVSLGGIARREGWEPDELMWLSSESSIDGCRLTFPNLIDRGHEDWILEVYAEPEAMPLDKYQEHARATAIYPDDVRILYPVLKLAGEAGEVAERLGKMMRDEGLKAVGPIAMDDRQRQSLAAEIGDVLWYVANLATDLGLTLEEVAKANLTKLKSRQDRGVLCGSGDDR